jgi:hypothetical protein
MELSNLVEPDGSQESATGRHTDRGESSSHILILQGKIKLLWCLINLAPRHEHLWESGGFPPQFLPSALVGDKWSASCLCSFTHDNHWIGGRDTVEKRKNSCLCWESNAGPAHSPSLYGLSCPGFLHSYSNFILIFSL